MQSETQDALISVEEHIGKKYGAAFDPLPELTARLRKKKFYVPHVAVEDRAKPHPGILSRPRRSSLPLC